MFFTLLKMYNNWRPKYILKISTIKITLPESFKQHKAVLYPSSFTPPHHPIHCVTFNFGLKKWLKDKLPYNRSSMKYGRRLLTEWVKNCSVRNLENICLVPNCKPPRCRKWFVTKQNSGWVFGRLQDKSGLFRHRAGQHALWQTAARRGLKRKYKSNRPGIKTPNGAKWLTTFLISGYSSVKMV